MPALPFVRYRALNMAEELFLHIAKMRTALGSPQGVPVGSQVTCVHLLAYMGPSASWAPGGYLPPTCRTKLQGGVFHSSVCLGRIHWVKGELYLAWKGSH